MLQPRVWIKNIGYLDDVKEINFTYSIVSTVTDDYQYINFDEVIFMQNTTMKDVNGKYIYEGDILRITTTDELFVVRYDLNRGWRADGNRTGVTLQDLVEGKKTYEDLVNLRLYNYKHQVEVVGNVFENTELYDENSIFEYEKRRLENA